MAADPAVTERIRTDVENKFGRWKAWCKQHGTTRFTGSYKSVDASAQPVQLKANSFGELRRTLRSVKDSISDFNKGVQFVSITAWNDKEGATQQITESKPFEAYCLLGAIVNTADLE